MKKKVSGKKASKSKRSKVTTLSGKKTKTKKVKVKNALNVFALEIPDFDSIPTPPWIHFS